MRDGRTGFVRWPGRPHAAADAPDTPADFGDSNRRPKGITYESERTRDAADSGRISGDARPSADARAGDAPLGPRAADVRRDHRRADRVRLPATHRDRRRHPRRPLTAAAGRTFIEKDD